jgi:hypothetical protein
MHLSRQRERPTASELAGRALQADQSFFAPHLYYPVPILDHDKHFAFIVADKHFALDHDIPAVITVRP